MKLGDTNDCLIEQNNFFPASNAQNTKDLSLDLKTVQFLRPP